jgi:hypothetical protein
MSYVVNRLHQRNHNRSPRGRALLFESLEPRLLMAFDYAIAFASDTLPAHAVTGFTSSGTAKLVLTNNSLATPAATGKADIFVYAHPVGALDATGDILLGKYSNATTNITIGHSGSPITVSLKLPTTASADQYDIVAIAKRSAAYGGAEVTEVTGQPLSVDSQVLDIKGEVTAVTLPTSLISGSTTATGTVTIKFTNVGNIAVPAGAVIGMGANLVRTSDSQSFYIDGFAAAKAGGMKVGATITKTFSITIPRNVESGTYQIEGGGNFMPTGPAAPAPVDVHGTNNSSTFLKTVTVTQGTVDLTATISAPALPSLFIQGVTAPFKVTVSFKNAGTVPLDADNNAAIQLVARRVAGGGDYQFASIPNIQIGGLAPGKTAKPQTYTVNLNYVTPGQYNLVAIVTDQTLNQDNNSANDTVVDSHLITVSPPTVDLEPTLLTSTLTGTVAGLKAGTASVTIANHGNVTTKGYTVQIFGTVDGTILPSSPVLGTLTSATGAIPSGGTLKATVNIHAPGPLLSKNYELVAKVSLVTQGDINLANNNLTGNTFTAMAVADDKVFGNVVPSGMLFTQTGGETSNGLSKGTSGEMTGVGTNTAGSSYFVDVSLSSYGVKTAGLSMFFGGEFISHGIGLSYNSGSAPVSLDGCTIVFSKSSVGATGTFTVRADAAWGLDSDVNGFFRFV